MQINSECRVNNIYLPITYICNKSFMINYAPQLFSGSLDTKTSTYGAGHSYMYDVFRSVGVGRSQK